ncbi:uncharacterized protein BO88DRAFT_441900 [Aspergillus vadensis CBS 113365]|uniref:Uncharacterized protein n=1 Tax=Aspergillus vadensis (strain CBS 113365 / IMI 142717 / IBT 24658) TaxID=1448311 RepID=A0A319CVY8_ASPVC|nr:hypothetical protein BO88DRAFT_441900 [Aspergillus vadensis CBS 113365]PYH72342.1 hypothetical protein BO88DRAFT_441900 [Aspergillus vadensis CBS 113365]
MFVDLCGALGSYTKSLVARRYSIGCKSCASSVVKLTLRSGTCRDAFCTSELVFKSSDTGVASESWVSRRDTNADRIIEALDKHTGEDCHDVIARPGGVSGFHPTRVMKSCREQGQFTVEPRGEQGGWKPRPCRASIYIVSLRREGTCFPAHPGQHSADSLDAADIGFPANGNSSSWSDWEHSCGNNTSRDEDLAERRTDQIW